MCMLANSMTLGSLFQEFKDSSILGILGNLLTILEILENILHILSIKRKVICSCSIDAEKPFDKIQHLIFKN